MVIVGVGIVCANPLKIAVHSQVGKVEKTNIVIFRSVPYVNIQISLAKTVCFIKKLTFLSRARLFIQNAISATLTITDLISLSIIGLQSFSKLVSAIFFFSFKTSVKKQRF